MYQQETSIYQNSTTFQRHLQKVHFDECCQKVRKTLKDNPQGLTLKQLQSSAGLSIQTTKLVVGFVAVQLKNKYYAKVKI